MLIQNINNSTPTLNWSSSEVSAITSPSFSPVGSNASMAQPTESGINKPSPAQLKDAVDKINSSMQEINSNLKFSIDADTQRVVVKVVESQTGKLIKQFPSEEALSLAKAIDGFQKGLLVKQSA